MCTKISQKIAKLMSALLMSVAELGDEHSDRCTKLTDE
jgi:hypothetical protein